MPCCIFLCFYYHRGLLVSRASEMGVLTLLGKGIEQYLSRNIFRFQSGWIFIFGSIHYPLSFFSNFYSLVIMYIPVLISKGSCQPLEQGRSRILGQGSNQEKKIQGMQKLKFIDFWGNDFAGTGALPPPLPTSLCLRH